ncbi:MAG: hypothetical protein ABFD92_20945 [Planctomycetaceae bacterium]
MTASELLSEGYRPGAPTLDAEAIDEAQTHGMTCRKCGGLVRYEGWSKVGSYRALAVCCKCGHEEEF